MSEAAVTIIDRAVVLDGEHHLPSRWLRDHGEDAASLNPDSKQRLVDTFSLDRDVAAQSVRVDGSWLEVEWSDGGRTGHGLDRLRRLAANRRSPAPRTGHGFTLPAGIEPWTTSPSVAWFDFSVVGDDDAWPEALAHLQRFGWVAFEGAELGTAASEQLAARIGYPRNSIFGALWQMNSGNFEHMDSAYESFALDVHTDGTYSHDGPGTIIFAQQLKTGEGGDSVLVDGFAAARDFQAADPEAADLLTRYSVTAHYLEPGIHLVAERPPLRVDGDGRLLQVSFHNYDRSPVLPAADVLDDVLDAYADFRRVFNDADRALFHPWKPGRVLLVDNWRCFHGRTAYTGERHFNGCYTNHEDLEGAYRVAGLG